MDLKIAERRKFMLRWANMLDRCDNPENASYHRYGGRGIKVCPEWYNFFHYIKDLPEGYFPRADLDRIDNNEGYAPGNVRWLTRAENSKNKSTNRMITFKGETMCASDWARRLGLHMTSLMERLDNWSLEDALTLPKGTRLHNRWDDHTKIEREDRPKRVLKLYEYEGAVHTMKQLSAISGIPAKLLRKRINERKWPVEKAMQSG